MKRAGYILIIIILIITSKESIYAQRYQFSQYYATPIIINPSFVGMIDKDRATLNYRDQWPSVPGTFTTYAAAYDHNFKRLKSGGGILMLRDKAGSGDLSSTSFGLQYAYDVKVYKKWHFRPGVHFSYVQRSINFRDLTFSDQLSLEDIAPTTIEIPPSQQKIEYVDFSASALGYSRLYWFGFTADHLMQPNQAFLGDESKLNVRWTLLGGARIPIQNKYNRRKKDTESVSFTALYLYEDGSDQLNVGAYWQKDQFVMGLWFRGFPSTMHEDKGIHNLDAVVALFGYTVGYINFGYSYDLTLSKLLQAAGGAHEISIIYKFKRSSKRNPRKKYVPIPCPGF